MWKPHTYRLHFAVIRSLRGVITAWEKWVEADHLESLPDGTPEEVMKILTPDRPQQPDKPQ